MAYVSLGRCSWRRKRRKEVRRTGTGAVGSWMSVEIRGTFVCDGSGDASCAARIVGAADGARYAWRDFHGRVDCVYAVLNRVVRQVRVRMG